MRRSEEEKDRWGIADVQISLKKNCFSGQKKNNPNTKKYEDMCKILNRSEGDENSLCVQISIIHLFI